MLVPGEGPTQTLHDTMISAEVNYSKYFLI